MNKEEVQPSPAYQAYRDELASVSQEEREKMPRGRWKSFKRKLQVKHGLREPYTSPFVMMKKINKCTDCKLCEQHKFHEKNKTANN